MAQREVPDTTDATRAAPRRRRRRIVIAAVAVGAVALIALAVAVWVRDGARPVRVSEVDAPTGSTLPGNPQVLRPAQGVYRYRGRGTDRISRPPKDQAQGPTMPGAVTHLADGCWTFRIDYSTNHWQQWRYCPRAGGLGEVGGTTFQRWDFGAISNDTTSTFECDAPTIRAGQRPGDRWRQSCTGTSTGVDGVTRSAGPYRFIGVDTLRIGGVPVRAFRYHRDRTTSGNQTGTERSDVWFSATTGMPLRNTRHLEATTPTVIGEVTYTEDGSFTLASLTSAR